MFIGQHKHNPFVEPALTGWLFCIYKAHSRAFFRSLLSYNTLYADTVELCPLAMPAIRRGEGDAVFFNRRAGYDSIGR